MTDINVDTNELSNKLPGDMEKVQQVVQMATAWRQEPEMWKTINGAKLEPSLCKLENLMPKILIGGNQNCGKSSLLNRLMPPAIQGKVELVVKDTCCTRSVTTIMFVKSNVARVTVTHAGSPGPRVFDWDDNVAAHLTAQLEEAALVEAAGDSFPGANDKFFTLPVTIELQHPEIQVSYTLMDTPGMFAANPSIKAKLQELVKKSHLYLAAGVAADDLVTFSSLEAAPRGGGTTLDPCRGEGRTQTILVATKADGIDDPAAMKGRVDQLQAAWPHLHKICFVAARWSPANPSPEGKSEAQIVREKLMYVPHEAKKMLGTEDLRTEVESFYHRLADENLEEATKLAGDLNTQLQSTINSLEAALKMSDDPIGVVNDVWNEHIMLRYIKVRDEAGGLDDVIERAQRKFASKWEVGLTDPGPGEVRKPMWIETFLHENPTFIKQVIDKTVVNGDGMIQGSGGIYPYLKYAYGALSKILLESGDGVIAAIRNEFDRIKRHVKDELMSVVANKPHCRKVMEEFSTYVMGIASDPSARLTQKLYEPPTGPPYPHNYKAVETYHQLVAKLNELHHKLGNAHKAGVPLDPKEMEPLHASVEALAAVSYNQDDVVQQNVQEFIIWHWKKTFCNHMVGLCRILLLQFGEQVQLELQKCHDVMIRNPAEYIVEPDPKLKPMLARLKEAQTQLSKVLPAAGMRSESYGQRLSLESSSLEISSLETAMAGLRAPAVRRGSSNSQYNDLVGQFKI